MLGTLLRGALDELVERPAGLGDADDRHLEPAAPRQRLQRREDLLVREVAGGAEKDQRIGVLIGLGSLRDARGDDVHRSRMLRLGPLVD